MKDDVLFLLRQKPDSFISGADISRVLEVTRSAVWKTIKALQEDGYTIEAVTNRGYRLTASPDILQADDLQSLLTTEYLGRSLTLYESVESTNRQALHAAENGAVHGAVFAAQEQTAGRGRLGRAWYAPRHTCLMMSLLLRPEIPINNAAQVTLAAGLAVQQAMQQEMQQVMQQTMQQAMYKGTDEEYHLQRTLHNTALQPVIKWPNDILLNNKKAAGILTELTAEVEHIKALVVGIGVNVHISSFPPELADSATSLFLETKRAYSRVEKSQQIETFQLTSLAAAILNCFEPLYDLLIRHKFVTDILPLYQDNCVTLGREIKAIYHNKEICGRAVALNPAGELIVQLPTGETLALNASEVSVRGLMGYGE
ncbi:MAG: biotin--[acetyl-CoA-carboxylase] ligase [Peptococcaceae bacterium]|nr:biotin--[acetyl-CoA-carboxylase] ligase [Peptococcaceae bacterium]